MITLSAGPEVLRTKAGQLRTQAASVAVVLNNVDQQMRNIHSSTLAARRADNLRSRYESQRQQLMDIPDLLTGFAQSLEQAADIYEQADQDDPAPGGFNWLRVLQDVNRFNNQTFSTFNHRLALLPPGVPRWYEWGKHAWLPLVTPLDGSVHDLVAHLYPAVSAPQPGPDSVPCTSSSIGVEPGHSASWDEPLNAQANREDVYKLSVEPAWSFTSIELFFLGSLLQLPGFLGVADPFSGCADDDLKVYLQLAHQSLIQRGCLVRTSAGEQLDPALCSLLHTVTQASQLIIAVHNDSFVIIYFTPESIVLQQPMPEHQVGFFLLENPSAILPHLQNLLASSPVIPAPGAPVTIVQPVLEHARAMLADNPSADKIAVCAASLSQTGLPPDSATAFALALARPVSAGYITLLHRSDTSSQRQAGCAWLVGASGGWFTGLPAGAFPASLIWQPLSRPIASFIAENMIGTGL